MERRGAFPVLHLVSLSHEFLWDYAENHLSSADQLEVVFLGADYRIFRPSRSKRYSRHSHHALSLGSQSPVGRRPGRRTCSRVIACRHAAGWNRRVGPGPHSAL
jgi:hypothetical protein